MQKQSNRGELFYLKIDGIFNSIKRKIILKSTNKCMDVKMKVNPLYTQRLLRLLTQT